LIESFNGKPQASLTEFVYAYGSPLNERPTTALNQCPAGQR